MRDSSLKNVVRNEGQLIYTHTHTQYEHYHRKEEEALKGDSKKGKREEDERKAFLGFLVALKLLARLIFQQKDKDFAFRTLFTSQNV